ncbi:MAG: hypothetical protein IJ861_02825 [Clostridia bacterium]|nr:hypothetical protein [Clostridia bacterium]
MAKRLLTECPYCHRKVSFIGASVLKTKGEHICKGCKCISNVVIHRALYGIASGVTVLSLLILVLYSAFGDHGDIKGVLFVFLPFLIFYILVPFFVRLEPCADKSAVNKLHRKLNPIPAAPRPVRKQEKPIELNVGDDFSASFLKAKSSTKPTEAESEEDDDRIIYDDAVKEDITSGIDIDISAGMNQEEPLKIPDEEAVISGEEKQTEPDEADVQPENDEKDAVFETAPKREVSFLAGNITNTFGIVSDEEEIIEDTENHDVSFLFGKKPE